MRDHSVYIFSFSAFPMFQFNAKKNMVENDAMKI